MRVAVIGANGQLGTDLIEVMSDWNPVGLTHANVDVCKLEDVRKVLGGTMADVVINTAAFNRVDDCEDDPDRAFSVNAYGARNLARVCADLGCTLMHVSTDYVFGGDKLAPYGEDDLPNPLSVYGVSKLAGEYFVRSICHRNIVVRTSGLYGLAGSSGKGGNFVDTMVRLSRERKPVRVVNDQVLTPTYTKDLARKLKELLQLEAYGLYHITNSGQCSWHEFAAKIFALLGRTPDFHPITTAEFGAKAPRPAYSVLGHHGLEQIGLDPLRPWPKALAAYLAETEYL